MIKAMTLIALFAAFSSVNAANEKSICGQDDRTPSFNPKVARAIGDMNQNGGCTLTMISKTCAVSAGHCKSTFGLAEFNTPLSRNGRIQHPEPEDIYPIEVIKSVYNGLGDDWAVLRVRPNKITGKLAGEEQGFYKYTFTQPEVGTVIRITGYGLDRSQGDRNLAQQTHTGEVTKMQGNVMYHVADTMGGNSGSSVIREDTQEIVAIHTNGGCYRNGGNNAANMLSQHEEFQRTIEACIASEE
ncbi:MAG: trypsin-like serine protease [Oligoflexia bacterium]|nr:trypsin-like serine protease [Oligoflexia bacterium]